MRPPPSRHPTPAESLFYRFLETWPEGAEPDVEELCRKRPDLADDLRALRDEYVRGRELVAGLRGGGPRAPADGHQRYTIRREIARGGMGTVLEVWDEELRRPLAMKVLRDADTGPDEALARIGSERRQSRLLNEAQILGQLDHPGIVPVIEVGRDATGQLFFTMQLVRGRDLAQIFALVRDGEEGWRLSRAVGVIQRVCEAMANAHARGVVHRDLKPHNIMVGQFGETYVMDWGLAKARGRIGAADIRLREVGVDTTAGGSVSMGAASVSRRSVRTNRRDADDSYSPLRTFDGDVVGTPAYMSPEQAGGEVDSVDELSDVYGAGAILYHLLAAAMPYATLPESAPHELLVRVRAGPPPPLSRIARGAPPELVAICEKAMNRDRASRYPSMQAMADDLRAWLEGRVVSAYRTGLMAEIVKWSGRQRLAAALLLGLLVVAGASAITLGILYRQSEQRRRAAVAAQADSLRRQSALFPQARGGALLPSFTEEFDGNRLDRRWMITGAPRQVEVRDGALRMTTTSKTYLWVALDPFVNVVSGDFELVIDYGVTGFTVPAVPRAERHAGVMINSLLANGGRMIQVARHAEYESGATPGVDQSCRAIRSDGKMEYVEDTSEEGRFRVSRESGRLSAYTWRDGWLELLSLEGAEEDLQIALFCRDFYFDAPATFVVERLEFRCYGQAPRSSLTSFDEQFSGPTLTPLLRLRATAGLTAILDGQLYMEKLEGRTGLVSVALDPQQGYVLHGNFDVSVRFDLDRFPTPDRGRTALTLEVSTPDGSPFANVAVVAEQGQRGYRAWYHLDSATRDLDGNEGALRVRRRGSTIHFLVWDDGWRELLERPEVHGELDMLFRIALVSTSEEGYVVALDDLRASSSE